MKPPVLITPPASDLVSVADLKAQSRVTHAAEDGLFVAYHAAAMALLDGYGGVLGRAVQDQTWQEEFDGFGELRLSLPDVKSVTVTAFDAEDVAVTVTKAILKQDFMGFYVETEGGSAARVVVQYVAGMPADKRTGVAHLVRVLVDDMYQNRSASAADAMMETPFFKMAIQNLRRGQI